MSERLFDEPKILQPNLDRWTNEVVRSYGMQEFSTPADISLVNGRDKLLDARRVDESGDPQRLLIIELVRDEQVHSILKHSGVPVFPRVDRGKASVYEMPHNTRRLIDKSRLSDMLQPENYADSIRVSNTVGKYYRHMHSKTMLLPGAKPLESLAVSEQFDPVDGVEQGILLPIPPYKGWFKEPNPAFAKFYLKEMLKKEFGINEDNEALQRFEPFVDSAIDGWDEAGGKQSQTNKLF